MKILIDNGHGENTPGKRSPDGRFREYRFARDIADQLHVALDLEGVDNQLLVPEESDVSLKERCNRANKVCRELGSKNVILISIHNNAAGNGSDWMNATGWQAHTTKGETDSDILSECLYDAAEINFSGRKIRKDESDGDRDWENDFYILKNVSCPAVLTENFFQDNKSDVDYLESEEGKRAIVKTHLDGILAYIKKKSEK